MPVIIKLPKPKQKELVNHLLTEQSGIGALDAHQGKVIADRLNTIETKSDSIYNQYTLTVDGDENTFYPVHFPFVYEYMNTVEITKMVHAPSIKTGRLRARFEYGCSGWGGYEEFLHTAFYLYNRPFIANAKLGTEAVNSLTVWLRGGGIPYEITHNVKRGKATVYYTKTDLSPSKDHPYIVEPRTTIEEAFQHSTRPIQEQLAKPLQGTILTNNIPPKVNTKVNQLTLQPGTYLLTSHVAYKESFPNTVVHWLFNGEGNQLVINRGSADGGGGTTPVMIYQVTKTMSIYSCVFQSSEVNRAINRNTLTALRMA